MSVISTSISTLLPRHDDLQNGCQDRSVSWKPPIKLQQPVMRSPKCTAAETWDSLVIYQPYPSHISVLSVYLRFSGAIRFLALCELSVITPHSLTLMEELLYIYRPQIGASLRLRCILLHLQGILYTEDAPPRTWEKVQDGSEQQRRL